MSNASLGGGGFVSLCLLMAASAVLLGISGCAEPPPETAAQVTSAQCMHEGTVHEAGSSFPAKDGCNTCQCSDGVVSCTDQACAPAKSTKPCKRTGCSGEVCAEEDVASDCVLKPQYACYANAACDRQDNGRCGFTETPELRQCLSAFGVCTYLGEEHVKDEKGFPSCDLNTCWCHEGGVICTLL